MFIIKQNDREKNDKIHDENNIFDKKQWKWTINLINVRNLK